MKAARCKRQISCMLYPATLLESQHATFKQLLQLFSLWYGTVRRASSWHPLYRPSVQIYDLVHSFFKFICGPVTVGDLERSNVFDKSRIEIMGSNPTRRMGVHVTFLFVALHRKRRTCDGLIPFQGVLSNVMS